MISPTLTTPKSGRDLADAVPQVWQRPAHKEDGKRFIATQRDRVEAVEAQSKGAEYQAYC